MNKRLYMSQDLFDLWKSLVWMMKIDWFDGNIGFTRDCSLS